MQNSTQTIKNSVLGIVSIIVNPTYAIRSSRSKVNNDVSHNNNYTQYILGTCVESSYKCITRVETITNLEQMLKGTW